MAIPVVKYKTTKTGPTPAEVNEVLVDRFVYSVLADQRLTPEQYVGQGRDGETPFKRTGQLVAGLFFKRASAGARLTGLIGTIRAPAVRFKVAQIRDKFLDRYLAVIYQRGQAWSVNAYAAVRAELERLTGMTRAQRDSFLAGNGKEGA